MTVSIALRYSLIRCLDNVGETIFNLFAPGCAGASHTPWLACPLVNSTATDSALHRPQAGYFSQAILLETMASLSTKPTQFSFTLYRCFPTISKQVLHTGTHSFHLSANQWLYITLVSGC